MKNGYVADRTGLIPMTEQTKLLIADGVLEEHIYTPEHGIDAAIDACDRGDDVLVVHSAIVIGGHSYPRIIKALAKHKAILKVLRKDLLIDCAAGEGVADGALDIKDHNANLGKKYGRKKKFTLEDVQKIIDYVNEGNTQQQAAVAYGTNVTLVSRMMNGQYFANSRTK